MFFVMIRNFMYLMYSMRMKRWFFLVAEISTEDKKIPHTGDTDALDVCG